MKETFDDILARKDELVCSIGAQMTFFPLCCSTGILKNMTASLPGEIHRPAFEAGEAITGVDLNVIKNAKYIHEIIRGVTTASRPIFFPIEFARYNALSLILLKVINGTDDGPSGGYNNYKAAQITMFDRIVADKRNPKFRFGGYNIVYSVDQFMDWLETTKGTLGEVYNSPAVPGGHGARVRGCIFTPDHDALQAYHDERLEKVRQWVLDAVESTAKGPLNKAVDKVAAKW